jgi:hypothetical protein
VTRNLSGDQEIAHSEWDASYKERCDILSQGQKDRNQIVESSVKVRDLILFSFYSPQRIKLIAWRWVAGDILMHHQVLNACLGFSFALFEQLQSYHSQKISDSGIDMHSALRLDVRRLHPAAWQVVQSVVLFQVRAVRMARG